MDMDTEWWNDDCWVRSERYLNDSTIRPPTHIEVIRELGDENKSKLISRDLRE